MSYKILDSNGNPVVVRGDDGEARESLGSAKGGVLKGVDRTKRRLIMIGTDESTDRDGDNIMTNGWMLDNYRKNPVFQWAHNYGTPPLAGTKKLSRKRNPWRMEFALEFIKEGIHLFADMIFELYADAKMNASSVGFIPYEWEEKTKEEIEEEGLSPFVWSPRRFLRQELLELSAVPVPSNPNAVQVSDDKTIAAFADEYEKMSQYIKGKGYKDFETDPMQVLKFETPLVLTDKAIDRVKNEMGEMLKKGFEIEDDFDNSEGRKSYHEMRSNTDALYKYVVPIEEIKELDKDLGEELERLYTNGLVGVSFNEDIKVGEITGISVALETIQGLAKQLEDSVKALKEFSEKDSSPVPPVLLEKKSVDEKDNFGAMLWDQKEGIQSSQVKEAVDVLGKISTVVEQIDKIQ